MALSLRCLSPTFMDVPPCCHSVSGLFGGPTSYGPSPCGWLSQPRTTMTVPTLPVQGAWSDDCCPLRALTDGSSWHPAESLPTFTRLDAATRRRWRLRCDPSRALRYPTASGYAVVTFRSPDGPEAAVVLVRDVGQPRQPGRKGATPWFVCCLVDPGRHPRLSRVLRDRGYISVGRNPLWGDSPYRI